MICRPAIRCHAVLRSSQPGVSAATCASCLGRRTFSLRSQSTTPGPVEKLNIDRLSERSQQYHRNRRLFLLSGALAGAVSFLYTGWKLKEALAKNPTKLDSSLPSTDPLASADAADRKVVVHDDQGREIVATGNSTVPHFPRTIKLPSYSSDSSEAPSPATESLKLSTTEYTLVGLGLRSVSFLGIQVYVVGYYIATSDIAALQSTLIKRVNPIATTLVPGERDELRTSLLDPTQGEEIWNELLERAIPARSVFRVVPVRDTDFPHLRDGFVRAIQAKSASVGDHGDDFGKSVGDFRGLFNRGSVPKRKELLLLRDEQGRLTVVYDDGRTSSRQLLGTIDDERISRALWLHYLAGKKVASEPARKSIVEGIVEFVERPVGTVATQVL
ncbi:chalcone isomerase [Coniochaeta ligniaria NRRL 30616]|uniref:Chalcone isomerase n=1 Tax=Coniochaeta ligniaria NRRL 30616 TaxID=1408157 RepID=A0A1J7IQ99_9PEZI|nr:chalcone isomerase [Coniochaeta ligniaria NRRL 30616]